MISLLVKREDTFVCTTTTIIIIIALYIYNTSTPSSSVINQRTRLQ